ncbi:hypothetical protein DF048_33180 [Burkholderia seminalis]|nr:hypothetical protein DF032_32455 [Burkholderia seminalis]RQS85970.1 hypothetical protein DF048_33180 [Burkholderia seminalis]
MPKSSRKPVVGPTACYRGAGHRFPNPHGRRFGAGQEGPTAGNPARPCLVKGVPTESRPKPRDVAVQPRQAAGQMVTKFT